MRTLLIPAFAAMLTAAPAAAQALGARTIPPEQILAEMGSGNSDEELARAVAAAAAFPLGTAANPVRVGGPDGAMAYIAGLRCADGSSPKTGASAAAGTGAFGSVVAAYPLDCGRAAPGAFRLVMDLYHEEHREDRAPPGFIAR